MLEYCGRCREKSVVTRCYNGEKGDKRRVCFCINKGCGYRQDTTNSTRMLQEEKEKVENGV